VGPSKLCSSLPTEFSTFLEYSRSLGFQDKPDYQYIKDLFNNLSMWEGFQNTAVFDWDGTHEQPQNPASNDPAQRKCEGYVIFLSFFDFLYIYLKLCLGCAPRCVNTSLLKSSFLPNFLALFSLHSFVLSILSIQSVYCRFDENGHHTAMFVEIPFSGHEAGFAMFANKFLSQFEISSKRWDVSPSVAVAQATCFF
jgi:hypothetical protein